MQHSGAGFFTGATLGLFCFTLRSDTASHVKSKPRSFDKILTWLTAGKHGFTHCGRRKREHASLFMFPVFCLVGCVALTDADTDALPPPPPVWDIVVPVPGSPGWLHHPCDLKDAFLQEHEKAPERDPGRCSKMRDRFCLIWS